MSGKAESIIGFAVKADKVIYGLDMLKEGKRKRYLIIFSPTVSDGSKQAILSVAKRDNVPIIISESLIAALHKAGAKVIGIANKQMADAIIKFTVDSKDYLLIKSEEI